MKNIEREEFAKKYFESHSAYSEERLKMVLETCDEEPFLYRYRPMKEEHDFLALEEEYFWQHTLDGQNDKEEGLLDLTYEYFKRSSSKVMKKVCNMAYGEAIKTIEKINKEMRDHLRSFREPYGVICFSESSCCHKMWINYSNQYRGICIAYSKEKLIANKFHLVPTLYRQKRCIADYFDISGDSKGHVFIKLIDNQTEKILITKTAADWEYEKEWRHIDDISKGNRIPTVTPEKIYIGYNCSLANRERIIRYCMNNKVEYIIQSNFETE